MERLKIVKPRRHSGCYVKPKKPYDIILSDGKMKVCPTIRYRWDRQWLVLRFNGQPISRLPFSQHTEESLTIAIDLAVKTIMDFTNCKLVTLLEMEIRELLRKYSPKPLTRL